MDFESNDHNFKIDDGSDYDSNDETDGSETVDDVKKPTTSNGKQGVCVKCNKEKRIRRRSMCSNCYRKDLKAEHGKEGRMTSNLVTCLKCNQLKKHKSRGLCSTCYSSVLKANELEQYPKMTKQRVLEAICVQCNKTKKIICSSMCQPCYKKNLEARRRAGEKKCSNCKRLKQLETNGFCSQCNLNNVKPKANPLDQKLKANSNASDQNLKADSNPLDQELQSNSNSLDQKLKANLNPLDQELQTNSNALDQELKANSNASDQELQTNLIYVDERPNTYSTFMIVCTDFVKRIELVGNPTTFEIEVQDQKVIDELLSAKQVKEKIDHTVLTSPSVFHPEDRCCIPSKYSTTSEVFIRKLTQYTRSKLKPLQKKRIKPSVKKLSKEKQSNSNVSKEEDHVPQSRPIQLAKRSSKVPVSKDSIQLSKSLLSSAQVKRPKMLVSETQANEKEANQTNKNLQKCSDCQQMKPLHARNLCSVCYQRFMTEKNKKEAATKSTTNQTGRKQFFVNSDEMNQKIDLSQYELLFGTSRKRKIEQSDNETFSDDEFYSMF